MARPHKQTNARRYHIAYHDEENATVDCLFLCPYCEQKTTASFEVNASGAGLLEQGGCFEPLRCGVCGKISDVLFFHNCKD